tara:strand:- start:1879 stop:2205 length:327 start_codon:yes stop_codon:yes gene_type:complete
VDFVKVQAEEEGDGDDEMMERAFNRGDWTRDTSREEHVEYFSDRRRGIIEEWMERCIDEGCPGWQSVRELEIWARTGWGDSQRAEASDEVLDEPKEHAWRMLDEVWRV